MPRSWKSSKVVRVSGEEHVDVGQGVAVPAQPVQRPRAMVADSIIASGRRQEPGRNRPRPVACGRGPRRSARAENACLGPRAALEHAAGEVKGTRQVARVLVSLAQHPFDIRVIGLQSVETIEVGDRLGQPPFREGQPAAVDEGLGIIGVGGEPAVHLGAFGLTPRLRFEDLADDPHGSRRRDQAGSGPVALAVDAGYGRRVPVQPQRGELVADSPQIPDQNGLLRGRWLPASCRRR